jgi:hypothetical protein
MRGPEHGDGRDATFGAGAEGVLGDPHAASTPTITIAFMLAERRLAAGLFAKRKSPTDVE